MHSLFVLTLVLFAPSEAGTTPPAPFTATRFREHVAYLASDDLAGRGVDSPGIKKASDYIIRHLKDAGAKSLAADGSYIQTFPHATKVTIKPEASLALADGASFTLGQDFSIVPESPDGQWEAEMVFVGYGVAAPKKGYDDFADVDLQGKLAVVFSGQSKALRELGVKTDMYEKWQECERRGAVGLVLTLGQVPPFPKVWMPRSQLQTRRTPCILMGDDVAEKLFGPTKAGGLAALESALTADGKPKPQSRPLPGKIQLRVQFDRVSVIGRNIVALMPGKGELAKEAILVSSHHDHLGADPALIKAGKDGIYNGADDNASGCAALLLLAQALHDERSRLRDSRRSVIFACFDAEEQGLAGSRFYVNNPLWKLERTAANVNFDMVGRLNRGKLLAMDSESSAFLAERILALAPSCGLTVETRLNGARRSDHANFLDREIPAVHFNTGMHPDYHQVTDEVDRIDSEGGARVAWLAYRLLRELMETPGPLRYRRPSPTFDIQSILGFVFKFGIIPEQNAQSGRSALIRFVVPGSLAAKHGLKSGDEITGVNGVEFHSIIDAAITFSQLRFDQGLRLSVRRQGKSMEISVPAEAFKDFLGPSIRPLGKDQFEVLFRYKPAGKVKSVALAGTFNDWNTKANPMEGPDKDGYFSTRLTLKGGTYEYKFVVDEKTWMSDPSNFRTTGPHNNNLLTLGGSR